MSKRTASIIGLVVISGTMILNGDWHSLAVAVVVLFVIWIRKEYG